MQAQGEVEGEHLGMILKGRWEVLLKRRGKEGVRRRRRRMGGIEMNGWRKDRGVGKR